MTDEQVIENLAIECYREYMGMTDKWHPYSFADSSEDMKAEMYARANRQLTILQQAGYVQLDEDQSLRINPYSHTSDLNRGWMLAQRDMLNSNFRRIRRE